MKKLGIESEKFYGVDVIDTITQKEYDDLKIMNKKGFDEFTKEDMLITLESLLGRVMSSKYINTVTDLKRGSISPTWDGEDVNSKFVSSRLKSEMDAAREASPESLALKICFWANRIAHQIETEVVDGAKKRNLNTVFRKYALDPTRKLDFIGLRETAKTGLPEDDYEFLLQIIENEKDLLGDIDTPEALSNMLLGFSIREELYNVKQDMIKFMILMANKNPESKVKVTVLEELKRMSIKGGKTIRFVMREVDGIAPVVMHCGQEPMEKFLEEYNLPPFETEQDKELAKFARGKEGIIGIHFTLTENDRRIVRMKLGKNERIDRLNSFKLNREDYIGDDKGEELDETR